MNQSYPKFSKKKSKRVEKRGKIETEKLKLKMNWNRPDWWDEIKTWEWN